MDMDDPKDLDLMQLGAAFGQMASSSINLSDFVPGDNLLRRMRRFEPVAAARTFANLLLRPQLQGNAYRAEVLAHLALASGTGKATPRRSSWTRW